MAATLLPWFAAGTTAFAPAVGFSFLGATARFPCGAPAGAAFLSGAGVGVDVFAVLLVGCCFLVVLVFLGFAVCEDDVLLGVLCCAFATSGEAASPKQIKLEIHAFRRGKASFKRIPSASLSIKTIQIIYLERLLNLKFYVNLLNIGFIPMSVRVQAQRPYVVRRGLQRLCLRCRRQCRDPHWCVQTAVQL